MISVVLYVNNNHCRERLRIALEHEQYSTTSGYAL